MAPLTTVRRNSLSTSEFAGPKRSYPIDTIARARNALARVSAYGTPQEKATVRAKVHVRYPQITMDAGVAKATKKA